MQDVERAQATCTEKKVEMSLEEHLAWLRWYAANAKQAALVVLGWHLDRLRLAVGLVEVVERDVDVDPGSVRFLPLYTDEHGEGWCVLVRDVEVPR